MVTEGGKETMPEKIQDRLFRLKCGAYGVKKPIGALIRAMTDEELELTFESVLEELLQTGRQIDD